MNKISNEIINYWDSKDICCGFGDDIEKSAWMRLEGVNA